MYEGNKFQVRFAHARMSIDERWGILKLDKYLSINSIRETKNFKKFLEAWLQCKKWKKKLYSTVRATVLQG